LASANLISRRRDTPNGTSIFCGRALVDCLNVELSSIRVSCVRFSPNSSNPVIVSCGWDKVVKVSGSAFTFVNFCPSVPRRMMLLHIFATSEGLSSR
jgi:hypothetical protein